MHTHPSYSLSHMHTYIHILCIHLITQTHVHIHSPHSLSLLSRACAHIWQHMVRSHHISFPSAYPLQFINKTLLVEMFHIFHASSGSRSNRMPIVKRKRKNNKTYGSTFFFYRNFGRAIGMENGLPTHRSSEQADFKNLLQVISEIITKMGHSSLLKGYNK